MTVLQNVRLNKVECYSQKEFDDTKKDPNFELDENFFTEKINVKFYVYPSTWCDEENSPNAYSMTWAIEIPQKPKAILAISVYVQNFVKQSNKPGGGNNRAPRLSKES